MPGGGNKKEDRSRSEHKLFFCQAHHVPLSLPVPHSLSDPLRIKWKCNATLTFPIFLFSCMRTECSLLLSFQQKKSFINLMHWFQQKELSILQAVPRYQMQCNLSCQPGIPLFLEGTLLQSQSNSLKQLRHALCINWEKSVGSCKLAGTCPRAAE